MQNIVIQNNYIKIRTFWVEFPNANSNAILALATAEI